MSSLFPPHWRASTRLDREGNPGWTPLARRVDGWSVDLDHKTMTLLASVGGWEAEGCLGWTRVRLSTTSVTEAVDEVDRRWPLQDPWWVAVVERAAQPGERGDPFPPDPLARFCEAEPTDP